MSKRMGRSAALIGRVKALGSKILGVAQIGPSRKRKKARRKAHKSKSAGPARSHFQSPSTGARTITLRPGQGSNAHRSRNKQKMRTLMKHLPRWCATLERNVALSERLDTRLERMHLKLSEISDAGRREVMSKKFSETLEFARQVERRSISTVEKLGGKKLLSRYGGASTAFEDTRARAVELRSIVLARAERKPLSRYDALTTSSQSTQVVAQKSHKESATAGSERREKAPNRETVRTQIIVPRKRRLIVSDKASILERLQHITIRKNI